MMNDVSDANRKRRVVQARVKVPQKETPHSGS